MPFGMPGFSAANIIGNLLFSGIGYIAYSYGKKMDKTRVMLTGVALMGYSYVVSDTLWMYAIGTVLTAYVWITRNDG